MLRATDETLPIMCLQTTGRVTREEIERVRPLYDRVYARRQPIVAINDARLAHHDAGQRKLWAEWTEHCSKLDLGVTKATIILLDSAVLRGALTALNWLAPRKLPQIAVADAFEAVEVARLHVEKAGIECRPETWGQVRLWLEQGYPRMAGAR